MDLMGAGQNKESSTREKVLEKLLDFFTMLPDEKEESAHGDEMDMPDKKLEIMAVSGKKPLEMGDESEGEDPSEMMDKKKMMLKGIL